MGGLTDTDDIRMTNLDSGEKFTKQVEENDPVEETIVMEVDNIEEEHGKVIDESEDIENPTPACDLIPEIQVIPVKCLTSTADNDIVNLTDADFKEEAQISADSIDTEPIISLKQSTDNLCQNTQVDDVVSVSSSETGTGTGIVTNTEAVESNVKAEAGDNPISEGDQRGPGTSPSPVTMAEEATVASSDDNQPQEDTDNAAREAEEAKRKEAEAIQKAAAEEEAKRKEEQAIQKAAAEEEAKRKEEEAIQKAAAEEEAKRKELQRKEEEEAIQKAAAEEEARRKQDAEDSAKREEEKAAVEKFDSFDVIGDLVDKENQELARRRRETKEVYRPPSVTPLMTDSGPGKEKSELGRELWEAASQGKAGPVKMLLAAGADPNFTVRTGLMSSSSPLVTAACRAHTSVIDSLLEHPDTLVNMPVSGGLKISII